MANIQISQLPIYSGTAADIRWFVMNNSGETETFKFSGYSSPFKFINETLKHAEYLGTGTNTITTTGNNIVVIGGGSNTIGGSVQNSAVIASDTINITFNANKAATIGSTFCGFDGGTNAVVAGSYKGDINGSQLFIGGSNTCYLANMSNSAIIGSSNSTLWTSSQSVIAGGNSHILQPYTSSNNIGFFAGDNNEVNGTGSSNAVLLGGQNNTLTSSLNSSIIAGYGNTLSGATNSVMLGCSGRTATTSSATFVENLVVFNYAALNFADDTAAAAGGVVLGQVYHDLGALRIRIV
jgi:hypothetical protein